MDASVFYPDQQLMADSNLAKALSEKGFLDYASLYKWSISDKAKFWKYTVEKLQIRFQSPYHTILDTSEGVKHPNWFKGAKINIVESCFNADESQVAIVYTSELHNEIKNITYKVLKETVLMYTKGIQQQGWKQGTAITLFMPMCTESVIVYLALIAAGMLVVSVPDSFSSEELQKRMHIANSSIVITCSSYIYNGKEIEVLAKVRNINAAQVFVHQSKNELVSNEVDLRNLKANEIGGFYYTDPQTSINILFSSGTTKDPKAIAWTHLTPIKSAADGYYHQDIQSSDVVTWTTGMGWMMAPWLIFSAFINRSTLAIYEGAYSHEDYGRFVEQSKISVLGTIPSLVASWRSNKVMEQFAWNIRVFTSTGEPSNAEDYLYLQSLSKRKAPIIEYCGGTEIGGGYISNTVLMPSMVSTFSTATLGTELLFLNENRAYAEEGDIAEVYIIPPALGLSQQLLNYDHDLEYYSEPIHNNKTLRKHGDAYQLISQHGYLFYKSRGRTDDAFNLGGIKVSAVEIEEIIQQHDAINEAAAVAYSNEGPEQLVVFYTTTKELDQEVLMKEIQQMIRKQLNPLFKIYKLKKIDAMPRTASNKLQRKELRKLI